MGQNVGLYSYNYEELLEGIKKYVGTDNTNLIEKVLFHGGNKIGDLYVIVNNEFWEDSDSYYNIPQALDKIFNVEDIFGEIFCTFDNKFGYKELISTSDEPAEIIYNLTEES